MPTQAGIHLNMVKTVYAFIKAQKYLPDKNFKLLKFIP